MPIMSLPPNKIAQHDALPAKLFTLNEKHKKFGIGTTHFPLEWPHPRLKWLQILDCSNLEGLPMTDGKFEQLRAWWQLRFEDMMAPAPKVLPPMRGVNHRINLIDSNVRHVEWCATCPQALEDQLREKMAHYE